MTNIPIPYDKYFPTSCDGYSQLHMTQIMQILHDKNNHNLMTQIFIDLHDTMIRNFMTHTDIFTWQRYP